MASTRYNALWITPWYPSPENLISGIFVREHAKAVSRYDNVTVIHFLERQKTVGHAWTIEQDLSESSAAGALTYRVRSTKSPVPITGFLFHLLSVFNCVSQLGKRGQTFDVVHAHTYRAGVPAALVARWMNVPLVITEHNSIFLRKLLIGTQYAKAAFAFRCAQCVMPVSKALQRAIEFYNFNPPFHVVGNTFDPNIFKPDPIIKKTGYFQITFVNSLILLKVSIC